MPLIRPISDLRNKAPEISKLCHESGEPVFITKNGESDLVVMSAAAYDREQARLELYGLLAAAEPNDPAVTGALRYLTQHQKDDGTWAETATTGTGFPTVFHLKYHLYRIYFPLYALARFRNIQKGAETFCGVLVSPHQFERRNGARVNR